MRTTEFKDGAVRDAVRRALGKLRDMKPLYRDIAEYMVKATRARFRTGTAPDGSQWAPKSQATLDRYKRLGYGNLPRPLIGAGKALSRQIQRYATAEGAVIGSSLIYSGVMQDGAAEGAFGQDKRGRPIPWGRIPARAWLGMPCARVLTARSRRASLPA